MMQSDILWSQKANTNVSTLRQFGYFLYEFVGARFTILAFIGLFNVATYNLDVFGWILSGGISIFLYYIISDAFSVFWTGINLEYFVTKDEIIFQWGVIKIHELTVPFNKISKISALCGGKDKRHAILFENSDGFKNGDFGFSKEIYFNQLSFENVRTIVSLVSILNDVWGSNVEILQNSKKLNWVDKIPSSSLYLKFVQLVAFIFLYFSTSIALNLIDNNCLTSLYVQDVVIKQELVLEGNNYDYNIMETKEGYKIKLRHYYAYKDQEVKFYVSPLFKNVTKFDSYKPLKRESLENGYKGFNVVFKSLAIIVMLFSSSYIFYKRGDIPFTDLSVFLIFPILIIFIAFYLFH